MTVVPTCGAIGGRCKNRHEVLGTVCGTAVPRWWVYCPELGGPLRAHVWAAAHREARHWCVGACRVAGGKPIAPPGSGTPGPWAPALGIGQLPVCSTHRPLAVSLQGSALGFEADLWSPWALGKACVLSGSTSSSVPPAGPTGCCEYLMGCGVWTVGYMALGGSGAAVLRADRRRSRWLCERFEP